MLIVYSVALFSISVLRIYHIFTLSDAYPTQVNDLAHLYVFDFRLIDYTKGETMKQRLNKFLIWICAIGWTIFLSILLLQPEAQPIIPTGVRPAPPSLEREILFSSIHIVAMCFTSLIWCLTLNIRTNKFGFLTLAIVLVAYGLGIEYLQGNVAGRTAQWWDMLANGIGLGLGFWLWHRLKKLAVSKRFSITI